MKTGMPANPYARPSLRRLLLAALAGGLGVFGLGIEPAPSSAQHAGAGTIAASAAKQDLPDG
jgi:hypothetical protein